MGSWRGVELTGVSLAEPGPGDLRLRPYRPGDVPAALAGMQDRSMHEFLPLPDPYTADDARNWCERVAPGHAERGDGVELVLTGPDDVMLGSAGLKLPAARSDVGEIGYSVHVEARGRGLAMRATRLLASWGFAHGLARIELRVAVGNLASARTALHAGFRFDGVQRDALTTPVGPVEGALFARLRGDPDDAVTPWLPPMTGVGDDVLALRPLTADDADVIAAELADPGSQRWAVGDPPPDIAAVARSAAARAPLGRLVGPVTRIVLVDRASGHPAGVLELRRSGLPDVVALGYGLLPGFRGRGSTSRALRLFAGWAFGHTGIARLELGCDVDNTASRRVAERAGFGLEGVARGRLRRPDGSFADEARYGLVRPDADPAVG